MDMKDIVREAHENAVAHGFWEPRPEFGTLIALVHSELSEALEEAREGRPNEWHRCTADGSQCGEGDLCEMADNDGCKYRAEKPEGIAAELADAVIRIADMCGALDIDLDRAIAEKMAYNRTRPYKHGKKF